MHELLLLITAVAAGTLGSLLGLGGGIIIVPVLTLVYGVEIRYAIAASLIPSWPPHRVRPRAS